MFGRRSLLLVCPLLTTGVVASANAQSLADVARKEEARRKAVSQPGKVYTNKDLQPTPTPAATSTTMARPDEKAPEKDAAKAPEKDAPKAPEKDAPKAPEKDAPKEAATKDAAPPPEPVKDKTYWAGRLKALQDQLDRDQTFADALQSRINALTTDFVNRDDPAQKRVIERDRLKALAELDRLKKAIPDDRKAIANLLDEARRAGVPPGWLR